MSLVFISLTWFVFIRNVQRVYLEHFKEMFIKIQQQQESVYILDHLEESIIIISDNQIEFVNDLFLNQFKNLIYDYEHTLSTFNLVAENKQQEDQGFHQQNPIIRFKHWLVKEAKNFSKSYLRP